MSVGLPIAVAVAAMCFFPIVMPTGSQVQVTTPHGTLLDTPDLVTGAEQPEKPTQLVTEVQDPDYPSEPWIVTSYRRQDESPLAFARRHRVMVWAVREAIAGG